MLLGLVCIGVFLWIFYEKGSNPLSIFSKSTDLNKQVTLCHNYFNDVKNKMEFIDDDNDECIDAYDPCLDLGDNKETENKDTDVDGMPDNCDAQPNNAEKFDCIGNLKVKNSLSSVTQCCTNAYQNKKDKKGTFDCG